MESASAFKYAPYAEMDLEQWTRKDFEVSTGDLYFFNGQFLHSAKGSNEW